MTITTNDWTEIEKGQEVRISGESGAYVFHSLAPNGDIWVFGGTKNPTGTRSFRAFAAGRVRIYRPRSDSRRFIPGPAIGPTARRGAR